MADRQRRIEGTRRRDRALVMSATCLVVMLFLALFALIAWPCWPGRWCHDERRDVRPGRVDARDRATPLASSIPY
jgi:hypothetical protein